MLPLYTTITASGAPVIVRNVNDAGVENKLGNHRFLRFTPNITGTVTDHSEFVEHEQCRPRFPDAALRHAMCSSRRRSSAAAADRRRRTYVAGTTYVLDVYDCANGCAGMQGVAGDYDLTVTIN